jgi:hypothetical protein
VLRLFGVITNPEDSYGDEKGACEMLFSYGFLEDSMDSARAVFLDLGVQEDDPLGIPKMSVCTCAPGFRVFDKGGMTQWESDFVWLAVVNEEDGFAFNFAQTNDGQQELRALWKDHELRGTGELGKLLKEDDLYKIFRLRAVALIQNRVEQQLQLLYEQEGEEERQDQHQGLVRDAPKRLTSKLRRLELELLEKSYGALEDEVSWDPIEQSVRWLQVAPLLHLLSESARTTPKPLARIMV